MLNIGLCNIRCMTSGSPWKLNDKSLHSFKLLVDLYNDINLQGVISPYNVKMLLLINIYVYVCLLQRVQTDNVKPNIVVTELITYLSLAVKIYIHSKCNKEISMQAQCILIRGTDTYTHTHLHYTFYFQRHVIRVLSCLKN